MSYIMEHEEEFSRLEKQCRQKHYSLEEELKNLKLFNGAKVLDAGCGGGVLSRFLADKSLNLDVNSCDASELRVKQAQNFSQSNSQHKKIKFFYSNLESIQAQDNSFDFVICRYVYEYLKNPLQITKELTRVLKPGGKLCLIDLDGVFFNLHTSNQIFQSLLGEVQSKLNIDLFVGRKLANFVKNSGLTNIKKISTLHDFQGEELEEEYINTRQRLINARPDFIKILETEAKVDRFTEMYLSEMKKDENTLFHNKFVVIGTK